jgi:hypothetical protein
MATLYRYLPGGRAGVLADWSAGGAQPADGRIVGVGCGAVDGAEGGQAGQRGLIKRSLVTAIDIVYTFV